MIGSVVQVTYGNYVGMFNGVTGLVIAYDKDVGSFLIETDYPKAYSWNSVNRERVEHEPKPGKFYFWTDPDAALQVRWTPGQKLNSIAEFMRALVDGVWVIHDPENPICCAVGLVNGVLEFMTGDLIGKKADPNIDADWYVYTPSKPKDKRKREVKVFVNVYKNYETVYMEQKLAELHSHRALALAVPHTFTVDFEV